MIARIWKGRTPADKADAYVDYVKKTGITAYRSVEGSRGQYILKNVVGDVAEITVLTLWESMESVKAFAGPEPHKPVYYPEDEDYLLEFAESVDHFEVMHASS